MFFLDAGFQSAKSLLQKATVAEVPHEDQFNGKSLVGIVNYIEFHITHVMCALYLTAALCWKITRMWLYSFLESSPSITRMLLTE